MNEPEEHVVSLPDSRMDEAGGCSVVVDRCCTRREMGR